MSYSLPSETITKAGLDDPNWGTGAHEIRIDNTSLPETVELTTGP